MFIKIVVPTCIFLSSDITENLHENAVYIERSITDY